jgi:hypothetical protein
MRTDAHIDDAGLGRLARLAGSRLLAYGSDKPGVESGVAVEDVFIEAEDAVITLRVVFERTDVCGEVGDHLHFEVEDGFSLRPEAESEGGVYYHFKGELIRSVIVHRATLEHARDGVELGRFEYDAGVELVLESGSLVFFNDDLSTPIIESLIWPEAEGPALPDPAASWPSTIFSSWTGSWTQYEVTR